MNRRKARMVYGVILASGVGKRMGADIPKQYIKIAGKPIIIYTIESMLRVERIDMIYIAVSRAYVEYMKEMLDKYFELTQIKKMIIVEGGAERIDTINNVTASIMINRYIEDDDVIIFHDAVRPFVTRKILEDSIDGVLKYGATVAGLPAVDTMLCSQDGCKVDSIPVRSTIFHGQAPDSFRLKYFLELAENLTDDQKKNLTGTSQFCIYNNRPIYLIEGDPINFKITTKDDLIRAEMIVNGMEEKN